MTNRYIYLTIVVAVAFLSSSGCSKKPDPGNAAHLHAEEVQEAPGIPAETEVSDLDRTVTELFAAGCEHAIPTYQCDECRYETGVVRVRKDLLDGGLVQVQQVALRKIDIPFELNGEIKLDERKVAHISPVVPGLMSKVHVDLGQKVSVGQPLFEIDSPELAGAQGDYLQAQAMFRLTEKNYQRQKELLQSKVTSEREYLEAQQAFETAEVQMEAGKYKLVRLGIYEKEMKTVEAQWLTQSAGHYVVRAPIAGTVLFVHATLGELAEPGTDAILIADVSNLWVWGDLYENQMADVNTAWRTGTLTATVTVDAYPTEVFSGTVDFVGATMDESSRTVKIRISLANPGGRLRPGMFAKVRLYPQGSETLAIPLVSVLSDEGRDFVFIHHEGDYYIRRPVIKGRVMGDLVEILAGLKTDQKVVTTGAFILKSDVLRSKMGAGCAD